MIDLSTCVPGQKVKFRNGTTGVYVGFNRYVVYPYMIRPDNELMFITHKRNGHHSDIPDGHDYDVIKILPLETPEEPSMIDLSTCVPGQKVEYRNGTMGEYYGVNRDAIYSFITKPETYKYISHKQDGRYPNAVEHSFDVVKIYPRETQMTDEELTVSNEFITFVRIQLDHEQRQQLRRYLNLHYLGDVDCNELDENLKFVPKYPEKETQEFKDAMWRADMSVDYQVKVVYDVNGKCKLELL